MSRGLGKRQRTVLFALEGNRWQYPAEEIRSRIGSKDAPTLAAPFAPSFAVASRSRTKKGA
jgi:hypothetical protein